MTVNQTSRFFSSFMADSFKRMLDVFLACTALILLSPILLFVALRIKRDSPGPVIFHGVRAGKGGKPFQIIKFRTMYENAESYQGPVITAKDDPRITPVGRWLRDSKLNELPQFWNVIRGEMSLVGPRPEIPEIIAGWPEDTSREILSIRPGITSPASILYRDEEELLKGEPLMDTYLESIAPGKLRLDQLYVRHRSFWLDLDVIFWTFLVLLPSMTNFQPPEGLLFWGPISKLFMRHFKWFVADTLVSLAAISLAGLFVRLFGPLDVGWQLSLASALIFAFLFSVTGMVLGVNRVDWSNPNGEDILILIPTSLIATILALIINNILPNPEQLILPFIPNGIILLASLLSFLGFILVRFRQRVLIGLTKHWFSRWSSLNNSRSSGQASGERVLVVGGGENGQLAVALLSASSFSEHFKVIGYVDDNLFKQDTRIRGVEVLGKREDIPRLVEECGIGLILFAIHNISANERHQLLNICKQSKARTVLFPDIPAALNTLSRSVNPKEPNDRPYMCNQHRSGDFFEFWPGNQNQRAAGSLPCELCLIKINPMQVDRWLERLEEKALSNDLNGIKKDLMDLRSDLFPDVRTQIQANQET